MYTILSILVLFLSYSYVQGAPRQEIVADIQIVRVCEDSQMFVLLKLDNVEPDLDRPHKNRDHVRVRFNRNGAVILTASDDLADIADIKVLSIDSGFAFVAVEAEVYEEKFSGRPVDLTIETDAKVKRSAHRNRIFPLMKNIPACIFPQPGTRIPLKINPRRQANFFHFNVQVCRNKEYVELGYALHGDPAIPENIMSPFEQTHPFIKDDTGATMISGSTQAQMIFVRRGLASLRIGERLYGTRVAGRKKNLTIKTYNMEWSAFEEGVYPSLEDLPSCRDVEPLRPVEKESPKATTFDFSVRTCAIKHLVRLEYSLKGNPPPLPKDKFERVRGLIIGNDGYLIVLGNSITEGRDDVRISFSNDLGSIFLERAVYERIAGQKMNLAMKTDRAEWASTKDDTYPSLETMPSCVPSSQREKYQEPRSADYFDFEVRVCKRYKYNEYEVRYQLRGNPPIPASVSASIRDDRGVTVMGPSVDPTLLDLNVREGATATLLISGEEYFRRIDGKPINLILETETVRWSAAKPGRYDLEASDCSPSGVPGK